MFRVQNGLNYYYVMLDTTNGTTRSGMVKNGIGLAYNASLSVYPWPGGVSYNAGQLFNVSVEMNAVGYIVYVRAPSKLLLHHARSDMYPLLAYVGERHSDGQRDGENLCDGSHWFPVRRLRLLS